MFVHMSFLFHQRAFTNAKTEADGIGIPLKRPGYKRITHLTVAECDLRRRVWRQQRAPLSGPMRRKGAYGDNR